MIEQLYSFFSVFICDIKGAFSLCCRFNLRVLIENTQLELFQQII